MSSRSVREYIESIQGHYKFAKKTVKTVLLDNFVLVTGLDRKHAIKLLSRDLTSLRDRSGRPCKYEPKVYLPHIKTLWFAMEQIGAKKMKAALPLWLPYYSDDSVTDEIKANLLKMSHSTIDRFIKLIRIQSKQKGLSTTRPGNFLSHRIPIKPLDWRVDRPGFVEADTVAHCGDNIMGEYANSVNLVDIDST